MIFQRILTRLLRSQLYRGVVLLCSPVCIKVEHPQIIIGYKEKLRNICLDTINWRKTMFPFGWKVHLHTAIWYSQVIQIGTMMILHATVHRVGPVVKHTVNRRIIGIAPASFVITRSNINQSHGIIEVASKQTVFILPYQVVHSLGLRI